MKGLRGLTAKKLSEVYCDTEIEPTLVLLSGDLSNRTTNRSNEARLDVQARGFWERGLADISLNRCNSAMS